MTLKSKLVVIPFFMLLFLLLFSTVHASALTPERIEGPNRYDTAIEVSKNGWDQESDYIILATGEDFPDALAGAPLSKKYNAPVLLTPSDRILDSVMDEIKRIAPNTVILLGGEVALSRNIEDTINSQGFDTNRIAGDNRFETASEIAADLDSSHQEAMIANGMDFPDALSAGTYATDSQTPILLTMDDQVPKATESYLNDNNIEKTYAIGGELVIGERVLNALPGPQRISGENRFETSMAVINELTPGRGQLYFATGTDFPDALTSTPLASKTGGQVVLTHHERVLEFDSQPSIADYIGKHLIQGVRIIGGEVAVSSQFEETLSSLPTFNLEKDALTNLKEEGGFLQEVLQYESTFSANQNHGDPDHDPGFVYLEGDSEILVTVPHSVVHYRKPEDMNNTCNEVTFNGSTLCGRSAEIYTGALGLMLHEYTNVHVLYVKSPLLDVSHYHDVPYKEELERILSQKDISMVIDLHGAGFAREFDIDLGTAFGELIEQEKIENLKSSLQKQNIHETYENHTFSASTSRTLANYTYHELGTEAVQVEIHRRYRDPRNQPDLYFNLLFGMSEFIEWYNQKES
ncbi:putative N-acetylmuramoyl-L-alanine amidase [Salisediminibacterium beveridgei]|uniref:Putative N-acetylmuramoyl-L-alanine amidase n=1 Tax=Salisediminibacterium beveridgei TaxID=632773 RepID=A0A1D7QRQ2_9BACI|nr:putative N-acetylmuramoyl-L-alanine amidase [Salisediminibacterium beveridgei]